MGRKAHPTTEVLYNPSGQRLYSLTIGGGTYSRVTKEEWQQCHLIPIYAVKEREQFLRQCLRRNVPNPAFELHCYRYDYWFSYIDTDDSEVTDEHHHLTKAEMKELIRAREAEGCQDLYVETDPNYPVYEDGEWLNDYASLRS